MENFSSVQRWLTKLDKRSGSANTREVYLRYFRRFCEYAGLNPDQLIAERQGDLRSEDPFVRRRAEERLDKWFVELDKQGLSRNTCALAFNAVRSFYKGNYMRLEVEETPSAWPEKHKPGLTKEDLKAILDGAEKPIHRAIILCQAQSGLSISDLLKLRVGDIKKQLDDGAERIHLRLQREKEKENWFDTFFGAKSTEALRKYLETRDDPSMDERLFPCTDRNVDRVLARLSLKAGLGFTASSHDLRKFFSTSLKMARVNDPAFNETLIEYWMGHSLGKVRGSYFVPPFEEQLRLYKLAEERLEP